MPSFPRPGPGRPAGVAGPRSRPGPPHMDSGSWSTGLSNEPVSRERSTSFKFSPAVLPEEEKVTDSLAIIHYTSIADVHFGLRASGCKPCRGAGRNEII
eukprot:612295-Hanusia_phi.AAC.1